MNKKTAAALMAAVMSLTVSLNAFAAAPTQKSSAEQTAVSESAEGTAKTRKVIKKAATSKEPEAKTEEIEQTGKKESKKLGGISAYRKTLKRSYGSFSYPQNAVLSKVDNRAHDIIVGEGEDALTVRLRAFDRSTSLGEELVDDNGLLYGMYTGFLTAASSNYSGAEISKGLSSQPIRRQVVALFNRVLAEDGEGKATTYTQNEEMDAVQLLYEVEDAAENCIILHGNSYDYVVLGIVSGKNKVALDRLCSQIAASLREGTGNWQNWKKQKGAEPCALNDCCSIWTAPSPTPRRESPDVCSMH